MTGGVAVEEIPAAVWTLNVLFSPGSPCPKNAARLMNSKIMHTNMVMRRFNERREIVFSSVGDI